MGPSQPSQMKWWFLFLALVLSTASKAGELDFAEALRAQDDCYRALSEVYRTEFRQGPTAQSLTLKLNCQAQLKDWPAWDQSLEQALNSPLLPPKEKQKLALNALSPLWQRQKEDQARSLYETHLSPVLGEPYPAPPEGQIDPHLAKLASSILPGTGLMMAGQWGAGFTSLGLNSLFLWVGVTAYQKEQYALAALALFFEWGWYQGGRNAAEEAAVTYNHNLILKTHQIQLINWEGHF